MAYTVEFLKTAEEELAQLPTDAQRKIVRKVEALRDEARPAGVEQLSGAEKFLRLRVGNYRVIYSIEGRHLIVLVIRIGHRKDVYENLKVLARRVSMWRQPKR